MEKVGDKRPLFAKIDEKVFLANAFQETLFVKKVR